MIPGGTFPEFQWSLYRLYAHLCSWSRMNSCAEQLWLHSLAYLDHNSSNCRPHYPKLAADELLADCVHKPPDSNSDALIHLNGIPHGCTLVLEFWPQAFYQPEESGLHHPEVLKALVILLDLLHIHSAPLDRVCYTHQWHEASSAANWRSWLLAREPVRMKLPILTVCLAA